MYNQDFLELVKMMALGSKASFNYNPTDEEIVLLYGKTHRLPRVHKN